MPVCPSTKSAALKAQTPTQRQQNCTSTANFTSPDNSTASESVQQKSSKVPNGEKLQTQLGDAE